MSALGLKESIAAELSQHFQLRQIDCVGLEAKHVSPEIPDDAIFSWDVPKTRLVWELEGDSLRVLAPVSVFIEAAPGERPDSKTRLADISIAMRLEYGTNGDSEVDENKVPHYVGICSFLHLWPYLRADVQWLTTKLGLPPLLLPVIVSGHAAKQVLVSRLRDVRAEGSLSDGEQKPVRKRSGKKA